MFPSSVKCSLIQSTLPHHHIFLHVIFIYAV